MKPTSTLILVSTLLALPAGGLLLTPRPGSERTTGDAEAPDPADALVDAPLAPHRARLLDLALDVASAMPRVPHVKNRARAQESVAVTALELEQERRALRAIERIETWRRGTGYGELAIHRARAGRPPEEVEHWLGKAREVADALDGEETQAWHLERIAFTAARARLLSGERPGEPGILSAGDRARLLAASARDAGSGDLDALLESFEELVATADLDNVRSALAGCARLYARFYGDAGKRGRIRERIHTYWRKAPTMIRIEVMLEMAGAALAAGDEREALALVNEIQAMLDQARWLPEYRIPLMARLAGLRHRAGDTDRARHDLEAALALYDSERSRITDIYRAGALRAIAEAYRAMEDAASALEVYAMAVEAGVDNPNSRPRADDLAATCLSMALRDVEPDTRLWERMVALSEGLGHPW